MGSVIVLKPLIFCKSSLIDSSYIRTDHMALALNGCVFVVYKVLTMSCPNGQQAGRKIQKK